MVPDTIFFWRLAAATRPRKYGVRYHKYGVRYRIGGIKSGLGRYYKCMDRKSTNRPGKASDDVRAEVLECLPNLRRFAMSLTGNLADADDLLQTTVLRLLERGLPDGTPVLPWCIKVCRNLWIDEVRAGKVRQDAKKDPSMPGEQVLEGEAQVIGEMSLTEVEGVMASMSDDQRAVLELIAIEGFSYKEAAAALEIPIGTVMSRLARARATLIERHGEAA